MEEERVVKEEVVIAGRGSEGGRRPTGDPLPEPDTEVVASLKRRRFTKAYKLLVLEKYLELKKDSPGKIGEYLRSEGLYSTLIHKWRAEKQDGTLSDHRKGTIGYVKDSMTNENARLRRQLASVQKKLEQAEMLVELQKKVSQLILGDSPTKSFGKNFED